MSRLACLVMSNLAPVLDWVAERTARWLPGVDGGCVVYRHEQPWGHFDCWRERRVYMLQVARLEVVLDRK